MRLLVLTSFYPPFVGGVENIARAGAEGLATRGHEVTVLTCAAPGERDSVSEGGFGHPSVVRMACLHPFLPEDRALEDLPVLVGSFLDVNRFDGVHAHLLTYPWTPRRSDWLVEAFLERGIPFVDQAHGGDPERKAPVCLDLMARTPLLIADSFYVRERLERLARSTGEGQLLPPVKVLPPSIVSFETFRPDPARRRTIRESLGISEEEVLVFYPSRFFDIDGTLSTRKRPLASLQAFAELVRMGIGTARLLAVLPPGFWTAHSEEMARQGVRKLLDDLGIADRTVLLNQRVEHGDMADLFQAADVTIVPSVEGFGLVYLESMACGVPVVGLAEGASLEVVGDAGVLVEPGLGDEARLAEALAGLMTDGPRRLELGRRSRSRAVSLYPPEQWAGQLETVLTEAFTHQTSGGHLQKRSETWRSP